MRGVYCLLKKIFEKRIMYIIFDLVRSNVCFMSKNILQLYGSVQKMKCFQLHIVWLVNFRIYYLKLLYFKPIKFILYLMLHANFMYSSNFCIKLRSYSK